MSRASASYSHSHSNGSHATRESFDVTLRVAIIETHRAHSSRTPSTETHSVDSHECHRHQCTNAQNMCSCILNTLPVVLDFRQSTTFAVSHSPQDLWLAHLCHATRQTDSEEPSHHSRAASPPITHTVTHCVPWWSHIVALCGALWQPSHTHGLLAVHAQSTLAVPRSMLAVRSSCHPSCHRRSACARDKSRLLRFALLVMPC